MEPRHTIVLPERREIHVDGLFFAREFARDYDLVISLLDGGQTRPFEHPRHLWFWVDDTENPDPDSALLTMEDLETILGQDLPARTLVHCYAGVSRSTALAILLAVKNGYPLDRLDSIMHWGLADPNAIILSWSTHFLGVSLAPIIHQARCRALATH